MYLNLKKTFMKRIYLVALAIVCSCTMGHTQSIFETEIVRKFPLLKIPIDSVQEIAPKDTLDKHIYNLYLKNTVEKKPIYILNGKKELEKNYYGLLNTHPSYVAQYDENHKPLKDLKFYDKVYPLGRIGLQPGYYSLIVKVFSLLSTYYDIHTFTKEGKLLSVVPLYYFENIRGMKEQVGVLHVKSSIGKDGKIYWWEHYPNRIRKRIYILNKEGFFEVINEKVMGKLED